MFEAGPGEFRTEEQRRRRSVLQIADEGGSGHHTGCGVGELRDGRSVGWRGRNCATGTSGRECREWEAGGTRPLECELVLQSRGD